MEEEVDDVSMRAEETMEEEVDKVSTQAEEMTEEEVDIVSMQAEEMTEEEVDDVSMQVSKSTVYGHRRSTKRIGQDDDDELENTGEGVDANVYFGVGMEKLRKMESICLIGCLSMNIVDPPEGTSWGFFNDRLVEESKVDRFASKFANNDLVNCAEDTVMSIVVKPDWVANLDDVVQTVGDKDIDQVPELKLTPEGEVEVKRDGLWVLGGNHRHLALQNYVDPLTDRLTAMKVEASILKRKTVQSGGVAGTTPEEAALAKAIEDFSATINRLSKWAVRLYDLSKQHACF